MVIMPRFVAESCLELIERERVTTSHMVPANFIRILEAPVAGLRPQQHQEDPARRPRRARPR